VPAASAVPTDVDSSIDGGSSSSANDVGIASLRGELLGLKPRALQKRAVEAGVAEDDLDEAEDNDAIIALILDRLAAPDEPE
jgi:hypothetical protein